jgi:serine/threonine protein kinase/tetratricopeptide (TPR) repeat protein
MSERDIFLAALEIQDRTARDAWLSEQCGADAEMRRRIEELLQAHAAAGEFLEKPAAAGSPRDIATTPARPQDHLGSLIAGKYKLLQVIGEGGMGAVYMADQLQPIKRRVAVKLIKSGMDSRNVLARFESERQALALMDHPNIAKVLEAGTVGESSDELGEPSRVSDRVPDDTRRLTSLGSPRPFFVMELVKGIPLTEYCDQNRLSVGDRLGLFRQICSAVHHAHQKGIIHRDLKPSNILVESHDGKPVPKVIDFGLAKAVSGMQLTENTLFTALGTVAGTPLYMAPEQAAFNAIDIDTRADIFALGVILYELLTGSTPITRDMLKKAAFDELLRVVREQEPPTPSKRISTSEALPTVAANRQMEPIKLGRFVRGDLDWIVMKALAKERDRRYESATAFAQDIERFLNHEPVLAGPPSANYRLRKFVQRNKAQVAASLLVLVTLLCGMAGTTFGLVRARIARGDEAKQRLIAEQKQEEAEKEKARAEKAEEQTLADLVATTDDAMAQLIGSKPAVGTKERTYVENMLERWKAFAERQADDERGQRIKAEGHHRIGVLWAKLDHSLDARTEMETALALFEKMVERYPAVPVYRANLAGTHMNLGRLLKEIGQTDAAQSEYEKALDLEKKLSEQFPEDRGIKAGLANTHTNLGNLHADIGRYDAARSEYRKARDIREKLVKQYPDVAEYMADLAGTHNNLSTLLSDLHQLDAARSELENAAELQKELIGRFPAVRAYQQGLALTLDNLGILLGDSLQRDAAQAKFEEAIDLRRKLAEQYPAVPVYQDDLAKTHGHLGLLLLGLGKREQARIKLEKACELHKKVADQQPDRLDYRTELGGSYCNIGILFGIQGQPAESIPWFDKAVETLSLVHRADPREVRSARYLRNSLGNRASAFDALKRPLDALHDWDRAIELSPPTERPNFRASRATSQVRAGKIADAVADVEVLTKESEWNAVQLYNFACVYAVAAGKIADKKQEYADRAMELLRKAVQAGSKDAAHMAKDSDLDPLRDREDFKKLMAELEAATKTPMKP